MPELNFVTPDWPAPANVRAASTTRAGGLSVGPYASLNLGSHVGDDPAAVIENRARVQRTLGLERPPTWLNQVHGTAVAEAGSYAVPPTADACVARSAGNVCVVLTADCLPVLFCDEAGEAVAAAHAGWRGLVGGVLEETIGALKLPAHRLLAWLGPAIEQDAFEVGEEVRAQFIARDGAFAGSFSSNSAGRWQADLYGLARHELMRLGVARVYGSGFRCFEDQERFFSYRRDGQTGRMASLIWLAP
jgi:polyphenol oxidase